MESATQRVGIDYRPALVNAEGIGRYVRGLVRGFAELGAAEEGPELALFAWTLAGSRFERAELGLEPGDDRLARCRVPGQPALRFLDALGRGIDDVPRAFGGLGPVALFHHTQYRRVRVRRALEVVTLHDLCYLDCADYVDVETAERMSGFAREAALWARAILVPTAVIQREVYERLGVPLERVHVTPLGCDHVPSLEERPRRAGRAGHAGRVERKPTAGAPTAPFVLSVSRVDARKNHVGALRAFEALAERGTPVRWIVAGAPGFGHEAFAAALAETRAPVEWRREVSERELLELYDGASAYFAPALEEGFGLTPLEAQRRGVPVVAADHAVAREVLGETALFCPPDEARATADALHALVTDAERRAVVVAAGLRRSSEFTWRRTAATTLEAYRAALASPSDSGPAGSPARARRPTTHGARGGRRGMNLAQVRFNWEALTRRDPLFAVSTEHGKEGRRWDAAEFYERGKQELAGIRSRAGELGLAMHGARALDFGCGVGRLSRPLAAWFSEVDGVDLSRAMLDEARARCASDPHADRLRFVHNTAEDLGALADRHYDLVFSFLTLQHMPPAIALGYLGELARKLAPGGTFFVQVPEASHPSAAQLLETSGTKARLRSLVPGIWLERYRFWRNGHGRMDMFGVAPTEVLAALREAGLEVVAADEHDDTGGLLASRRYFARRAAEGVNPAGSS